MVCIEFLLCDVTLYSVFTDEESSPVATDNTLELVIGLLIASLMMIAIVIATVAIATVVIKNRKATTRGLQSEVLTRSVTVCGGRAGSMQDLYLI